MVDWLGTTIIDHPPPLIPLPVVMIVAFGFVTSTVLLKTVPFGERCGDQLPALALDYNALLRRSDSLARLRWENTYQCYHASICIVSFWFHSVTMDCMTFSSHENLGRLHAERDTEGLTRNVLSVRLQCRRSMGDPCTGCDKLQLGYAQPVPLAGVRSHLENNSAWP